MNRLTDQQLLRDYAERRSESAFAELVRRHIDLIYSAALRMVCDSHLAEDVTQGAFVALARSAPQLTDRAVLSGWLHRTAQNIAAQTVRTDVRRRAREQEAAVMNELFTTEPDGGWEQIAPHLDAALGELGEADRDALLLRYFERKSAQEMAQVLGVSDEAAQKRVSRAVERLREFFAKRGVTVGASGLVVVISANAVQAAPVTLAASISTATAVFGTTVQNSIALSATKTIAMTTFQKAIIAVTVVVAGTGILYEAHRASRLQEQLQMLQLERESIDSTMLQLEQERNEAKAALATARNENVQSIEIPAELLRLRAEVTKLRAAAQARARLTAAETNDPTGASAKSWLTRVEQLRKHAESTPAIPELQLLTENDWLDAVKGNKVLESEADFRKALSRLRSAAKENFGNATRSALKKYLTASEGTLPSDWAQLNPYYEKPMDDAILERYELLQTGKLSDVPAKGFLFAEKALPVDQEYDTSYEYSLTGTRSSSVNRTDDVIEDAARKFASANNGLLPKDPAQLTPYLRRAIDPAELQRVFRKIPSDVTTFEQLKAVVTSPK
ncbi:MAG TPA: RNA polymerase sigma factor [Candidatus Acidoferrum sp.]|nr:RNA polymerase sigma factor [Candidatus Acidoferrum sp.]